MRQSRAVIECVVCMVMYVCVNVLCTYELQIVM
jgi:hypothetical protein